MYRKLSLLLFMLVLCAGLAQAQNHTLKGVIMDSTGSTMPGTTIVLIRAADSSFYKFSLTDGDGAFSLPGVENGKYVLQISYLGYQNFMMPLDVKPEDAPVRDLGKINLQEKNVELDGVVIEAEIIPIVFKKDTVEYNANAFRTTEDAKVEDLLKKMPGLEVDSEGNVTAHGEKVQKVLVDGKEFFGNDPKMATRNLPAKAVDKVQVFDKKSDMAEFTGVDDGELTRTINLKLKADYKEGMFGNAEVGVGSDEDLDPLRYKGRFSINRFQKKTQISTIGMINNVNQQGFGVQDYVDFMGGMGGMMRGMGGGDNSGVSLSSNLNNGNVTSAAAGLNFNWQPGKNTRLTSSYFYSGMWNNAQRDLTKTTFLESGTFQTLENNTQQTRTNTHTVNVRFEHDIDSLQNIVAKVTGKYVDGQNETRDIRQNLLGENVLLNSTDARYNSLGLNLNGDASLQYNRKFNRRGRSFSANVQGTMTDNSTEGHLDSRNRFYFTDSSGLSYIDTVLQDQENLTQQLRYSGKLSYTEPLGNNGKYLEFNFTHAFQGNYSEKSFYDLDSIVGLRTLNETLSSEFENSYTTERGGLSFQWNGEKGRFTAGVDGEYSRLEGNLISHDTVITKSFLNPLPRLQYRYQFSQSRRLNFNYTTNVQEPTAQQLAPIVDNSDPTRITTGNPALRAAYVHTARLNFFSFSPFSFTSIFAGLNGTYTQNKITNAVTIDSSLVQIVRPVNVARDINLRANLGFNTPIKALGIKVNLNGSTSYNRGLTYVNTSLSNINRYVNTGDFSIENRNKESLDAKVGLRLTSNLTQYEVNEQLDQSFLTQEIYGDITWNIGEKWVLNTTMNYAVYGGQAFDEQQVVPIWNASVTRYLLPSNKLQVKLYAFDLLNKNSGVNRTSDLNYVQEEVYQTVNRYVMLSVGYSILGFQKEQKNMGPGGPMRHGRGG